MNPTGRPIEIRSRDNLSDTAGNPAHAATFIRPRLIVPDHELRGNPRERERFLIHELFHFVRVRAGDKKCHAWEALLRSEWQAKALPVSKPVSAPRPPSRPDVWPPAIPGSPNNSRIRSRYNRDK
jgi:hypothetical protein